MQNVPEEWRERGSRDGGQEMGSKSWEGEPLPQRDGSRGPPGEQDAALTRARRRDQGASGGEDRGETRGKGPEESDRESLMMELSRLVQKTVKESSWWERRGIDCSILAAGFLCLPPAFMMLGSSLSLCFTGGLLLMGLAHAVITIKGTHLASHGALSESSAWAEFWGVFFIEVCGSFTARAGVQAHIKMHHAHTNIVGLGDSSIWKVPSLPRSVYLFIAPLAVPIITPLAALDLAWIPAPKLSLSWCLFMCACVCVCVCMCVFLCVCVCVRVSVSATGELRSSSVCHALRTVLMIALGMCSQYWLLVHVSGFQSPYTTLLCMLLCRAMSSIPYIHVNIFQHIGLPMFSPTRRPKRIYQMTHGVLNLTRNPLLDWTFGHSLINCHVEHHLFPFLSDNMCLKVKPIVSRYLKEKDLPYQEDSYFSRLRLFFHKYQELMVFTPPITELVGVP
ncbi:fatty acid desaturase 6 isoform X1 [Hypomesus transpacificus]|uniref:fatty acid desaturase 6 isoform X1 n=1 Tax=Hypomesus transpacificus TaxID=137520 RepID=UPI001F072939|nr:fatty acid desaturase 6 isoform X1 [Hypomesus transpacificus]XP_046887687.1 fatty acid desaturase 6 isoform X1 [Hypomesus transpacificus]